jgi:hypothetical protein
MYRKDKNSGGCINTVLRCNGFLCENKINDKKRKE